MKFYLFAILIASLLALNVESRAYDPTKLNPYERLKLLHEKDIEDDTAMVKCMKACQDNHTDPKEWFACFKNCGLNIERLRDDTEKVAEGHL